MRRALQAPTRQLAENAGIHGPIVVGEPQESSNLSWGYDALNSEYCDLVKAGIIAPTKVVRAALQDAASAADLLITTEAMVAEKPKKKDAMPTPSAGDMDF